MKADYSVGDISRVLFDIDPMNTCCKENDCFDEYDRVAESVVARLVEGLSIREALLMELSEWFVGGDCFDTRRLEPVLARLSEARS